MAVCPLCKVYISVKEEGKTYKGKKYHLPCFEKILDDMEQGEDQRGELDKYICKLFGIKKITPLISEQISNFVKIDGYSINGIKATLYYFFELGEREVGESVRGIGIVPYVYEEAKEFFSTIGKAKEVNKNFVPAITEKHVQIKKPNKGLQKIDISKIE